MDAIEGWLADRPEAFETGWERHRAAYLASPRRARELRSLDLDALPGLSDDEIVIAAASLATYVPTADGRRMIERYDRLAQWLRPEIDAAPTPRAKLATMQRLLVPRHQSFEGSVPFSSPVQFLERRAGICVTWTTAFVALGERLGLPLLAVDVPGHVFVRWDDGATVFNFDPTMAGREVGDQEYVRRLVGEEAARRWQRYVRVLTPRGLVALNLSNAAAHIDDNVPPGEHELICARLAVELDPENGSGWHNLLYCAGLLGPEHADEVMRAAEFLAVSRDRDASIDAMRAVSLVRVGRSDRALEVLESVAPALAHDSRIRHARALALSVSGRADDALAIIESLDPNVREELDVVALEVFCRILLDRDDGLRHLHELDLERDGDVVVALHVAVARRFLCAPADDLESARTAWDLVKPFSVEERSPQVWWDHAPLFGRENVHPCSVYRRNELARFKTMVRARAFPE